MMRKGRVGHTFLPPWAAQRAEAWLPSQSPTSLGRSGVRKEGPFCLTAQPW